MAELRKEEVEKMAREGREDAEGLEKSVKRVKEPLASEECQRSVKWPCRDLDVVGF